VIKDGNIGPEFANIDFVQAMGAVQDIVIEFIFEVYTGDF
jgi:hypothetical protein